jgi:site-specific DNA-methyltransferase (adenine-specific)
MTLPEPYYQDESCTIYHGDCREIAPMLVGVSAVLSDPPYGMNYDTNSTRFTTNDNGHGAPSKRRYAPVHGDDEPFDPTPWLTYQRVVLFGFNHFGTRLPVGTTLIWIKKMESGYGSFLSDAEVAWMKGGHGVYCHRDTSLLGETNSRTHPTQKPVGLMKWVIEKAGVLPGETILDPYMGSGTTLRAAKDLGRRAIGIEIEERYCEIAAKRLSQMVLPLQVA